MAGSNWDINTFLGKNLTLAQDARCLKVLFLEEELAATTTYKLGLNINHPRNSEETGLSKTAF